MKLAILSDSHDRMDKIFKFIEIVKKENINLVIHLGDFVAPFTFKLGFNLLKDENIKFVGVFGNNDGEIIGLLNASYGEIYKPPHFLEIKNKKFLIMHEPYFIDDIMTNKVNFILYGHTHQIDIRKKENLTIINPGELCGYITQKSTFVILDLEKEKIQVIEV
ncbi:MAG TPA: metallophosphoesterase [Desulfurobacteriaceae bacterium]|nr:metallophosphoesterase [Desulfurobacteriaceae bacterium]